MGTPMHRRLLRFLSPAPVVDYGTKMANRLSNRYPPSLDKPGGKRISASRMASMLEVLFSEAQAFQEEHRLGYLGRTRLSHAFKWRLIELGYSKEFIDMATEGLVVYLHKPKNSATTDKDQK